MYARRRQPRRKISPHRPPNFRLQSERPIIKVMRPFLRVTRALSLSLIASAVVSCAAALGPPAGNAKAPAELVRVQGGFQTAQAGRDLPNPIVLRVVDAAGESLAGVTVTLAVSEGGGTVSPASDTTDAHGEFRAKWTLGAGAVVQSL